MLRALEGPGGGGVSFHRQLATQQARAYLYALLGKGAMSAAELAEWSRKSSIETNNMAGNSKGTAGAGHARDGGDRYTPPPHPHPSFISIPSRAAHPPHPASPPHGSCLWIWAWDVYPTQSDSIRSKHLRRHNHCARARTYTHTHTHIQHPQ